MDASGLALDGQASPDDLESLPDIFSMDDLLLDFSDQEDTAALTTAQMASSCCPYQKKFDLPLPLPWDANQNLARFHIPCDDLAEVEWLSSFVDAAFSSGGDEEDVLLLNPDMVKPSCKEEEMRLYGTGKQEEEQGEEVLESRRSPISVLESSSSSCSYSSTSTTTVEQQEKEIKNTNKIAKKKTVMMMAQMKPSPGRVRSKRARIRGPSPTAWTSSRNVLNLDCSSFLIHTHNPTTRNSSSSSLLEMNCQNTTTKEIARENLHERDGQINLKCLHCGSQKTPQWRAGPLGPKTLCNACGVRFKSGRLYPEYRPVASPSFVASVHSNSHKKVMEIRTLKQRSYFGSLPPPLTPTTTSQPFLPKDYHLDDQWTLIRHS